MNNSLVSAFSGFIGFVEHEIGYIRYAQGYPRVFCEVATVLLKNLDGRTEVNLTQEGYLPLAQYAAQQNGYGSFFDAIERRLASL